MNTWTKTVVEARATARIIGVRSRAIADFADQIAEISDPDSLIAQDWELLIDGLNKLSDELKGEITNFSEQSRYWTK